MYPHGNHSIVTPCIPKTLLTCYTERMTAVAAWGYTPLRSGDVEDTHTPHRNVRVPDEQWLPFGFVTGSRGRSDWIKDFIALVLEDPELWKQARAIAKLRDETLGRALHACLARYVARHRHLLDESDRSSRPG